MKKILKRENGFTLIELIVVIAIIGILLAIAVPSIKGYTDKAKDVSNKQLQKIIENSIKVMIASGELNVATGATVYVKVENDPTANATGVKCTYTDAPTAGPAAPDEPSAGTTVTTATFVDDKGTGITDTALTPKVKALVENSATFKIGTGGKLPYVIVKAESNGNVTSTLEIPTA